MALCSGAAQESKADAEHGSEPARGRAGCAAHKDGARSGAAHSATAVNGYNRRAAESLAVGALPRSLPALAFALRTFHGETAGAVAALDLFAELAPVYRVACSTRAEGDAEQDAEQDAAREAASMVHAVRHAADRLRRLANAYGEWDPLDAAAYFDFSRAQAGLLVQVSERVSAVHATVYADLLLPSFRQAVAVWAGEYVPARQQVGQGRERDERFFEQVQPHMERCWLHAVDVLQRARRLLLSDIGFLAANGASEERSRWHPAADAPLRALPDALRPNPLTVPTLTLTTDFPLPPARQPGRLRRLRRHRARRQRR